MIVATYAGDADYNGSVSAPIEPPGDRGRGRRRHHHHGDVLAEPVDLRRVHLLHRPGRRPTTTTAPVGCGPVLGRRHRHRRPGRRRCAGRRREPDPGLARARRPHRDRRVRPATRVTPAAATSSPRRWRRASVDLDVTSSTPRAAYGQARHVHGRRSTLRRRRHRHTRPASCSSGSTVPPLGAAVALAGGEATSPPSSNLTPGTHTVTGDLLRQTSHFVSGARLDHPERGQDRRPRPRWPRSPTSVTFGQAVALTATVDPGSTPWAPRPARSPSSTAAPRSATVPVGAAPAATARRRCRSATSAAAPTRSRRSTPAARRSRGSTSATTTVTVAKLATTITARRGPGQAAPAAGAAAGSAAGHPQLGQRPGCRCSDRVHGRQRDGLHRDHRRLRRRHLQRRRQLLAADPLHRLQGDLRRQRDYLRPPATARHPQVNPVQSRRKFNRASDSSRPWPPYALALGLTARRRRRRPRRSITCAANGAVTSAGNFTFTEHRRLSDGTLCISAARPAGQVPAASTPANHGAASQTTAGRHRAQERAT